MTTIDHNSSRPGQHTRPRLIPLHWQAGELARAEPTGPGGTGQQTSPEITILHTNDFHSSVDGRAGSGRPEAEGEIRGGIARIAAAIRQARAAGPTLALDAGDSVFGLGTWWDAQGASATAKLRGAAGYDLAAIGNHDLEHGLEGLRELLQGGYPLVGANLAFEVEDTPLARAICPAYIAELAGWRIGLTGATTLSTLDLVPAAFLRGLTLTDPLEALRNTIRALEPLVDTVIVLSHLGFTGYGLGDREIAPYLAGTKVSVILGGHTHAALDPAPVIAGIVVCNAGAYGANINQVTLRRGPSGAIEVRSRLLPQTSNLPEDQAVAQLRAELALSYQSLHQTTFPVPFLPTLPSHNLTMPKGPPLNRDREWLLLARALNHTVQPGPEAILMVPVLYVLGQLPADQHPVSLAELMTIYPNAERLVEVEIEGAKLKELIELQSALLVHQQARPIWINRQTPVALEELHDREIYHLIVTGLVAEGGLGWAGLSGAIQTARYLDYTCSEVVIAYLRAGSL